MLNNPCVITIFTEWLYYSNKYSLQQRIQFNIKFLGTNIAFVKRVHYITIIISILINIIIMIPVILKHEETALAFIFDVFIIHSLVISKFPDFSLTCA